MQSVLAHRQGNSITTHELQSIPGGAAGTRETLRIMRDLTREWRVHPKLRQLAKAIVQSCPPKSAKCESSKIHAFVSNKIRYVRDVAGVETIQTPDLTLRDRCGDCDDQALLVASLLQSIGRPARFIAVGTQRGAYQHVYTETPIGPDWVAMETTEQGWPLGRRPRGAARMVQKI